MNFPDLTAETEGPSDVSPLTALGAAVRAKLTGCLTLRSGRIARQVHFSGGDVLAVTSNAKSELPGTLLHREGRMTAERYKDYLSACTKPKADLWLTALNLSALTGDAAADCLRRGSVAVGRALAASSSAGASFTPDTQKPIDTPPIPGLRFLMECAAALNPETVLFICPELAPSSFVRTDSEGEARLKALTLSPEEKGLVTVIVGSRTVEDVLSNTFLPREMVFPLLLAFFLGGLFSLEDAAAARLRMHEESLTEQQRALRAEISRSTGALNTSGYYEILDVDPSSPAEEIQRRATEMIERYASPSTESVLLEEERPSLTLLLQKIEEARATLVNPAHRAEYDGFRAAGGGGAFVDQSRTRKEQEALARGAGLIKRGRALEALSALEAALDAIPDSPALIAMYAEAVLSATPDDGARRDRALRELRRAMDMAPPLPEVFETLGEWLLKLNASPKAREAFRRALSCRPFSARALSGLGRIDPQAPAREAVLVLFAKLGELNHYELLGLPPKANARSVQAAYRDATKRFHPDRFFSCDDEALKQRVKEVYKRMVEAYMTLKTPTRRKDYDVSLAARQH